MPAQFWEAALNSPSPIVDGTAYASSVALTDVTPGVPFVIPANFLYAGQNLRIVAFGKLSTTATPTITLGIGYGGTSIVLGTSGALTLGTVTNLPWRIELWCTVRAIGSGTSGSILSVGTVTVPTSGTATVQGLVPTGAVAAVGLDTTTAKTINVLATWGTNSASNTLTCQGLIVEALN